MVGIRRSTLLGVCFSEAVAFPPDWRRCFSTAELISFSYAGVAIVSSQSDAYPLRSLHRQRKLRRVPTLRETSGRAGHRNGIAARRRARITAATLRTATTAGCQEH